MSKYPVSSVCPRCGEAASGRLRAFSPVRVCRACQTRYMLPTPVWERSVYAVIFLLGMVLFGLIAVGIAVLVPQRANGNVGGWQVVLGCSGLFGILALLCLVQAARELMLAANRAEEGSPEGWRELLDGEGRVPARTGPPGTVPPDRAEALLRTIAEAHGALGILRRLGNYRTDHLANATARFAQEMGEAETVLAVLDTSFLQNGKAGLIVTNRGVYSSFHPGAIWLSGIHELSKMAPGPREHFGLWFLVGANILLAAGNLIAVGLLFDIVAFPIFGLRRLQNRLLVNGEIVYAGGSNLRADFWIELLTTLAAEARAAGGALGGVGDAHPRIAVLETSLYRAGEPVEVRRLRDPSWREVEQSIRALDGEQRPSVRLCVGEGLALDVLGGKGTYALREPGEGWVYYDPSRGEEEVEVSKGAAAYRCPAFYVCTDLNRVLEIARHFLEAGAFD